MHYTSQFYETLETVLLKNAVSFYADLTGVIVETTLKPPAFDSIQSLLESDVYAKMLEEISKSDTEQAAYLRKQMKSHEVYYTYEAREGEQQYKVDLFKLRQSHLLENGVGILFLPKDDNVLKLSLTAYRELVHNQLDILQHEYEPYEKGVVSYDYQEHTFNDVLRKALDELSVFGLNEAHLTLHPISKDHPYTGGNATILPKKDGYQVYISYTMFKNIWITLSVIAHEMGHASYYHMTANESSEIRMERPDLWDECIAETIAICIGRSLETCYPELTRITNLRTMDAVTYSLDTLNVLLLDTIEEADVEKLPELINEFEYALYDPFRYYVATELANSIMERGHAWFIAMIQNTHGFALDRLILDYWEAYCKKYSSE